MKGQKIWVPLDPSFKQHEKIEGLDLSSIIDIDTEASIESFKDGIIVSFAVKLGKYILKNKKKIEKRRIT
jgi:hypothetical protein